MKQLFESQARPSVLATQPERNPILAVRCHDRRERGMPLARLSVREVRARVRDEHAIEHGRGDEAERGEGPERRARARGSARMRKSIVATAREHQRAETYQETYQRRDHVDAGARC